MDSRRTSNTAAVRGFVEELDRLVSKDHASVSINRDDAASVELLGNQAGYLRLGIELMKTGLTPAPASERGAAVACDLKYLVAPQSTSGLGPLLRVAEDFTVADREQSKFETAFRRVLIAVLVALGLLAAIGMVGVAIWFTS